MARFCSFMWRIDEVQRLCRDWVVHDEKRLGLRRLREQFGAREEHFEEKFFETVIQRPKLDRIRKFSGQIIDNG